MLIFPVFRLFVITVLAFGFFAMVGTNEARAVDATSCTDSNGYSYTGGSGTAGSSNGVLGGECGDNAAKAGSTVIGAATTSAAATQTVGLISARVSQFSRVAKAPGGRVVAANGGNLMALGTGTAAGSSDNKVGVWANGSWTRVVGSKIAAKFDGSIWTGMIGGDYKISENVVAGLAVGYEKAKYDTSFNNGNTDSTGVTVAPYFIAHINDTFSVDGTVGYTRVDYDLDRIDPIGNFNEVTGDVDGNRTFGTLNLNGDWAFDAGATLGINLGTLYAKEYLGSFVESDGTDVSSASIDLGRLNVGGRAGFLIEDVFEPYLTALLEYDYANEENAYDDRVGVVVGLGFNVFGGESFSANVEGTTTEARSGLDIWSVNATVRIEF